MAQVSIRFYAELNDFLPLKLRQVPFNAACDENAAVKHVIESLGVPHTEIDLILVNGQPVEFDYLVRNGDRISVYPVFETLDISRLLHVQPQPLRQIRFVLDVHLGRLTAYLRMLGFDSLYQNDYDDETLACISKDEKRILLTRDRGLLKRKLVTHGYYVRENEPRKQVIEVVKRFDLAGILAPFQRCLRCNGLLQPVEKDAIAARLPENTRRFYDSFHICSACDQIYWKGSHYQRMLSYIQHLAADNSFSLPVENGQYV